MARRPKPPRVRATRALAGYAKGTTAVSPSLIIHMGTPEASVPGFYGMGVGSDGLGNTKVDDAPTKVYYRFRSPYTSALNTIRWYFLSADSGSGYGNGTGGTIRITVETDDGTSNHFPTGTALATQDLAASGTGVAGRLTTFTSPATLTAGTLYHIVFANTDASPASNNFSVDCLYVVPTPAVPRNPRFPDSDWGHGMYAGSWSERTHFTPILDLGFAAGHYGVGYMELSYGAGEVGEINGTSKMARELFTVSAGARTVTAVGVRAERASGTEPMTLTLQNNAGTTIATAQIPATSFGLRGTPGEVGTWAEAPMSATLDEGATYRLVLSTGSSTTYWAYAIRQGSDNYGYDPATVFSDGMAQKTTNGTDWSSLGRVSGQNDLQFYFVTRS